MKGPSRQIFLKSLDKLICLYSGIVLENIKKPTIPKIGQRMVEDIK